MKKIFLTVLISFSLYTAYFILNTVVADAASLYIFPNQSEVYEGDSIVAELRLNTEGQEVNTIETTLSLPPGILEITDFSTGGSVFSFFVAGPEIRTDENSVFFQAASPGGFSGEGVVGKITLRSKNRGPAYAEATAGRQATLRISENSKVLLNDGKGTEAGLKFTNGDYEVVEKPSGLVLVNSESHPAEDGWYSGPFIRLYWDTDPNTEYSYVLTRDPNEEPDEIADEPVGDIKLTTNEEGIFYFNLTECNNGVCGPVSTRKIMKDNTPPEPFEPVLGQEEDVFDGKIFLSFTTEDKVSGVSYWEVYEGEDRYVARSPYILQNQDYEGDIKVVAVDKAGNKREAVILASVGKNGYNTALALAIIVIVAGVAVTFWVRRVKQRKKYTQIDSISQNDNE
ncbi:MAG: hypothetical protein A2919_01210 [Candidatus Spechtbacteria bacterium RIFCSPLOWO2_01_FULL_43_12]|uniref:Cohesin domain-containing protein n=1 Tax=Candidatus Spechtbacteria bacterium RIFCSPLOWO2_01_FULL_43_12 TaxID=1802162 RepID=A0A1G2HF61_9BACT|nr:MAG: hypothetical protein A2919_01210 [Candidatus Spechtbacteria bacterium RIFCSPLOWO2_01_FULL_43_12]